MLYVGGLDDTVTEEFLHAAFIPFGDLKSIQIPKDYKESKINIVFFYPLCIVIYRFLLRFTQIKHEASALWSTSSRKMQRPH